MYVRTYVYVYITHHIFIISDITLGFISVSILELGHDHAVLYLFIHALYLQQVLSVFVKSTVDKASVEIRIVITPLVPFNETGGVKYFIKN